MVNKITDYRLVEAYIDSPEAKRRTVAKKARQLASQKAWAKKYGPEFAKRKASNVITTKLSGPPTPEKFRKIQRNVGYGIDSYSRPTAKTQSTFGLKGTMPSTRKFVGNKSVNTLAGEVKPSTVKFNTDPGAPSKYGLSNKGSKAVTNKVTQNFTANSVNMSATEYAKYKTKVAASKKIGSKVVIKTIARGATRLIPGIGTAMLVKDVYDVTKWAMSQPERKIKGANIYGTVSSNNIYKGY